MSFVAVAILLGSLLLIAHSLFSMYVALYAWDEPDEPDEPDAPDAAARASAPASFRRPKLSFSVLLPARDEAGVIFDTVSCIAAANYPPDLLEIIVVCHEEDAATIREAGRAARVVNDPSGAALPRVRVETYSGAPVSKPRALNVGLREARHAVVAIFDAEDDVSRDIFNVVNTIMLSEGAGIVQAGVQLMNVRGRWFSAHNVLEYFFHFRSRLLYFARAGMMPLGGNTVFFRRALLEAVGGWDDAALTEDADIGVRLSARGERTRVVYDARHVTREETPASVAALVRQRTRWHQGFLQVLAKPDWRRLPTLRQRLLALFVFTGPLVQAALALAAAPAVLGGLWLKAPAWVVLVSYLPLYPLVFQLLITVIALRMFAREYGLRLSPGLLLATLVTFLPYHLLMGISAIRAVWRHLNGLRDWEKTFHAGSHRLTSPKVKSSESARPSAMMPLPTEMEAVGEL